MSFVHCMMFVIVALTIHSIPHESKKQVQQEEIDLDDLDSEPPTEIPADHTDIFHLNVGGEIIVTTRQTLMKIPESTLSILFNGDWEDRLSKDPNGNIFFDFNPTLFRHLLDQLQVLEFDSSVHLCPPFQPSLVELFIKMLRKLGLEQYLPPEKKNVITFNVGGQTITTQRTAFTQVSDSIFDTIVPSTKTMSLSGESDAFIDYDPKLFRYLINQLRQNSLRKNAISGLASKEEKLAFERMLNDFNIFVGATETTKSTVSTTSATTESVLYTSDATQANITEDTTAEPSAEPQPGPGGRVELRVVVSPETLQVQLGQTYELSCGVYGADASTTIYWIQVEPERRYALIDPSDGNDKQVTMSQVSLRARITIDDPRKIGKYTCMAQDAAGNSGSAVLTMKEGQPYYRRHNA